MSELSNYLSKHLGDRVADDIVREAAKRGHAIDRTAVYAYLRGAHAKRPREETLQALAAGFGLDVRHLRELAGRPAGELGSYEPDARAASLTQDQRDALDRLIVTIVDRDETDANTIEAKKKIAELEAENQQLRQQLFEASSRWGIEDLRRKHRR